MTLPWYTSLLQAQFLQTLFDDLPALAALQVTTILALALAIAAFFPKSAALRSCILLSALLCTLVAPLALLLSSHTGYLLELPLQIPAPQRHAALINSPEFLPPNAPVAEYAPPTHFTTDVPNADQLRPGFTTEEPTLVQKLTPHALGPVSTISYEAWLLILWACGTLAGALGIVTATVRIRRLIRAIEPVDRQRFQKEISRAAANLGIEEFPRIGTSRQIGSPVAIGVASNTWILIPQHCLNALPSDQLVQILTHEAAHIVHHDPLVRLIQRIYLAIWWWNPLAHRLSAQLSCAREENCDNVVLNSTEADVYGATLLEWGKQMASKRQFVGTVGLFGSRWSLEHRINGLLNPRRKIMTQVNRTVVVTVLAVFAGVTAVTSTTRIDAQESAESVRDQPINDRNVKELQFKDKEAKPRREPEHMALHRQFDHLVAAHRHMKAAGLEDLAQEIGQRAEAVFKRVKQGHPHAGQTERASNRYHNPLNLNDTSDRIEKRGAEEKAIKKYMNDVRESLRHLHRELRELRRDVDKLREDHDSGE